MDFPSGFIFGMYHVWYCAVTPDPAGGAADRRLFERLHGLLTEAVFEGVGAVLTLTAGRPVTIFSGDTSHPKESRYLRLHRLFVLVPLVAALLVPAVAFAGGEADSGSAGGEAAAMERTTFDHEWNDIRYYNHIADYTAATGNTITSFSEAPMLAEMVAAGDLPPVEERLPDDPYVVVP